MRGYLKINLSSKVTIFLAVFFFFTFNDMILGQKAGKTKVTTNKPILASPDTGWSLPVDGWVGNFSDPKINKVPVLEYPDSAINAGLEGQVYIQVLLDIDGSIMRVRVGKSSGFAILDSAAVHTTKKYRFTPAMQRGRRVRIWYELPFEFRLNPKAKGTR